MARTKFTGPRPGSTTENPPTTDTTNDKAANPPTAAAEAPAPASAAKPAPGQTRISKRVRGSTKSLSKDVLVLYEALTYGVDAKFDHTAVARAAGINEPAARMRYTRLIKRISKSLEDSHGELEGEPRDDEAEKEI